MNIGFGGPVYTVRCLSVNPAVTAAIQLGHKLVVFRFGPFAVAPCGDSPRLPQRQQLVEFHKSTSINIKFTEYAVQLATALS